MRDASYYRQRAAECAEQIRLDSKNAADWKRIADTFLRIADRLEGKAGTESDAAKQAEEPTKPHNDN